MLRPVTKTVALCLLMLYGVCMLNSCGGAITTVKRAEATRIEDCTILPSRTIVLGKEFPMTASIDVVYDQHDLKNVQYEFIGEVTVIYVSVWWANCAERHVVEQSQRRGANTVIIGDARIVGYDNGSDGFSLTGRLIRYK